MFEPLKKVRRFQFKRIDVLAYRSLSNGCFLGLWIFVCDSLHYGLIWRRTAIHKFNQLELKWRPFYDLVYSIDLDKNQLAGVHRTVEVIKLFIVADMTAMHSCGCIVIDCVCTVRRFRYVFYFVSQVRSLLVIEHAPGGLVLLSGVVG